MRITIDLGAIAHSIRRWWRSLFCGVTQRGHCIDCGKRLSVDELHYYGHTCERCEGIAFHAQEGGATHG
jgi:Zn finger protein HypA/HybF involved in hydrogenase expression